MASESGRENAPLIDELFRRPYDFEFFQAVRLLEWSSRKRAARDGTEPGHPVGRDVSPAREVVRFRGVATHSFPASSIARLQPPGPRAPGDPGPPPPPEMTVNFMGLTGPNGVLPQHYTTLIIDRVRQKDVSLRDFFDLFNHRAISLFHRAWEKYRFPIAVERAKLSQDRDESLFTFCLYCFIGLGTDGLRRRQDVDDETFLYYAGQFANRRPTAISLERMAGDYLALPADVIQFQGQWLWLSPDEQSMLPSLGEPLGRNCELGISALIGERVWDVQSKFRLRIGPLAYRQFSDLMPSGDRLRPLAQFVRMYVGSEYDFDVQLVLRAAEVPWCRLAGDDQAGARLGWNTWIRHGEMLRDADDVIFCLEDV